MRHMLYVIRRNSSVRLLSRLYQKIFSFQFDSWASRRRQRRLVEILRPHVIRYHSSLPLLRLPVFLSFARSCPTLPRLVSTIECCQHVFHLRRRNQTQQHNHKMLSRKNHTSGASTHGNSQKGCKSIRSTAANYRVNDPYYLLWLFIGVTSIK